MKFNNREFEPVESSNVKGIAYDEETKSLFIIFKTSSVYQYLNVPRAVYEDFKNAESKGRFLNIYIRGNYTFKYLGTCTEEL